MNRKPNEVSEETVKHRLEDLMSRFEADKDQLACYLHVMGGQSRSDLREVKRISGVKVIWNGSAVPAKWSWLLFWIPSTAALVRVFDSPKLRALFDLFSGTSMLGIYICRPTQESKLAALAKGNGSPDSIHQELRGDSSYAFYVVDVNYPGSKADAIEWFHAGQE